MPALTLVSLLARYPVLETAMLSGDIRKRHIVYVYFKQSQFRGENQNSADAFQRYGVGKEPVVRNGD
jgi:hypothetical protein